MNNVVEDAERALRMVREAKILIFDTETSGTDWKRHSPLGYVFCDNPREAVYVPVRAGGGGNLPDPSGECGPLTTPLDVIRVHPFEKALAAAFQERQRHSDWVTAGHNLKFDAHMAANAKVYLGRNLACTQNFETLIDEYVKGYSLEACAMRHGVQAKKGDELYKHIASLFDCSADRKAMAYFWELAGDDPVAATYARGDGVTTFQLYQDQIKQLKTQELGGIAKLESDLIWTLFRMERRGIKVDVSYLEQLLDMINGRVAAAYEALPPDFNVRSPIQIQEYLEANGRNGWPITDHGNPSFTESWLRKFPEGRNIVTVRKWSNLANSFALPLINEHAYKGRVHASINQLRADDFGTPARLSCSNPNLQQIPKRDKELATLFRKAFVADEGFDFHEADMSQCEPRLYAHYAQEPALIAGYLKEPFDDVHSVVAQLLGVERDPTAKRMNMGMFTGMYPKTFSQHMQWPLDKATHAWNQWHAALPRIRPFQDMAKEVLLSRGYIKTILGRRLRLENARFAYRAVSKIIQGSNADIIKYQMLAIDQMLEEAGDKDAHLLMSVHDSLEWQAAKNPRGSELSDEIKRIMVRVQEPPFNLRVPFAIDHKAGSNWSEATFS